MPDASSIDGRQTEFVKINSEFAFTSALGYVSCCSRLEDRLGCIHVERSNISMTGENRIESRSCECRLTFKPFWGQ
jgi:hypothetical protein